MQERLNVGEISKEWHGSYKAYIYGFFISLLFTLCSFGIVLFKPIDHSLVIPFLIVLALFQAAVQLIFFLHLLQEQKPRWKLFAFFGMLLILLIIAGGSFWVMNDLNNRMMNGMIHE